MNCNKKFQKLQVMPALNKWGQEDGSMNLLASDLPLNHKGDSIAYEKRFLIYRDNEPKRLHLSMHRIEFDDGLCDPILQIEPLKVYVKCMHVQMATRSHATTSSFRSICFYVRILLLGSFA